MQYDVGDYTLFLYKNYNSVTLHLRKNCITIDLRYQNVNVFFKKILIFFIFIFKNKVAYRNKNAQTVVDSVFLFRLLKYLIHVNKRKVILNK